MLLKISSANAAPLIKVGLIAAYQIKTQKKLTSDLNLYHSKPKFIEYMIV